jgi:regulator of nucleoside diphosphate kinase
MSKLLLSTDKLPEGMAVSEVFSMIQFTGTVEISERGVVVGLFERKRAEYQDIVDAFSASAPNEANAILGVQMSSSTQAFGDVTYLYLTYIGTPAVLVSE